MITAILPIILGIVISFLEKINTADNSSINITIVILNSIVIALIKIKEMSKFDKIKDIGKDQSIKYTQLYDKIERELTTKERKLSENEFLYWVSREFGNIEMNDPEISFSLKNKFFEECKKKGIPIIDDYTLLKDLMNENSLNNIYNPQNNNDQNNNHVEYNDQNKKNINSQNKYNNNYNNNYNHQNNYNNFTLTENSLDSQKTQISLESALKENENDKHSFKIMSKTFDNNAGLNWAIDLLKNNY
jgi:hypothetical protein